MHELFHNIRFYILTTAIVFSLVINTIMVSTISSPQLQTIRLTQIYGLTAFAFLYLSLLAGPFCYMFASFPWKKQYLKARRALGVASFYFAGLHATIAFFGQLGGFEGLGFLTTNYQIAIGLSTTALCILLLQAMTSFDAVIAKMTFPRWKIVQRFVYVAGIFIIIHIVMLGTHFQDLTSPFVRFTYIALAFLFFLEALRIDAWFQKRLKLQQQFGVAAVLLGGILIAGVIYIFTPMAAQRTASFGIHSQHAQPQQENATGSSAMQASMQGDRTLRYTVSLQKPEELLPNQNVPLAFAIYNAATGDPVSLYQKIYEKEMHMVVVDNTLTYFNHIHPQRNGNNFAITTQFPHPGVYRTYLTYQPIGAVEQEVGFSFQVGGGESSKVSLNDQKIDTNITKKYGKYNVNINTGNGLYATEIAKGTDSLAFTVTDAATGQPVTTLRPYLGAFGHLVMIHTQNYRYVHVHPIGRAPEPNENGGPGVSFAPMALLDQIKPGVYKVFVEFNPNNERIIADFLVKVN